MDDLSFFESRKGKVSCSAAELFAFVTDIRNFERFAPKGTINKWVAEKDFCCFSVSMIGSVTVRLSQKTEFSKVVYNGDALKKNDFILILNISDNSNTNAGVQVMLSADLNPVMIMMASKPIEQFLEMLINEMESFREWKSIII
jgi:hypothetical protein